VSAYKSSHRELAETWLINPLDRSVLFGQSVGFRNREMLLPKACQRVKNAGCAQHHKIWLVRLSKETGAVAAILTSA